jgi:hypothetical protein
MWMLLLPFSFIWQEVNMSDPVQSLTMDSPPGSPGTHGTLVGPGQPARAVNVQAITQGPAVAQV